ncbi:putative inhibitor of apoptosis [Oratosquilla oratoria]|uniref:putative inhibitor of apoptosis n=1 Tax=Oratosquilla oratoria TaxID=337810 RepID=UPI003F776B86
METDSIEPSNSSDISTQIMEVEREIALYQRLLEEEHEMKQCRLCMDEEVGAVFMPCAHLLACGTCAASLTQCPLCRSDVHYTVQVIIR